MDPLQFYGNSEYVNEIPCDGAESDDDLAVDSDSEYDVFQSSDSKDDSVVISETESEPSEDERNEHEL